jgi:hypothetical protein
MEKSMVSMLVVANTGGGSPLLCGYATLRLWGFRWRSVGIDPASICDDVLRIALSRHLMDGFTVMNGRIKGLAQNLKDAEERHEEFRCQTNNHLNAMRADDMDT